VVDCDCISNEAMKQYASGDSSSSVGEGARSMTKPGETLPLQEHDEFSESRQESSSPTTSNCHSYPSDTNHDEDREQQLFAPIPFVRSSTSCSRNRLSQLSVTTSVSGAADDDMDSDEDFIDSPSYHYASLTTPRNSPTNGNSSGLKRSRSCMSWLALAAGTGVAVLGAAVFWGGSVGNDPLKVVIPSSASAEPVSSETAVSKDSISDDEEDEEYEYTDVRKYNSDNDKHVFEVIEQGIQTKHVPPLSELVVGDEIRGNVEWMVDFAIIGNPKCGTTFLMHWLARSHDTYVHNGEVCSLSRDRPSELATMYYDKVSHNGRMAFTEHGHRIKGGLKCPKEISTEKGLDHWSNYFPETKFIVTTRHPVSWFQSFYNYHAYGQYPKPVPHPKELIGACYDGSEYLCTDHCGTERPGNTKICTNRANFHHSLSRLGKTPMDTPEEMRLLNHGMSIVPQKGKVFLMEISQLFPDHESSLNLREDISDFLDLKYDLHQLHPRHGTGTQNHEYTDNERKKAFVDICDDEYAPVREILVEQGKDAAEWIRNYFLKSEDVVVSSRQEFLKLLDKWGEDPCLEKKK